MASSATRASPPKLIYTALEGRALLEAAALPYFLPLLATTPRGDGHPVLLIPGFVATDATMTGMRVFLRSRGYHVENWGFGQNTGFKLKFSQALEQKVRYLHHKYQRKVSIVGWSLGGVYAYYVAHAAPECVRTVISLGSPMRFDAENLTVPMAVKMMPRLPVASAQEVVAEIHNAHMRSFDRRIGRGRPRMPDFGTGGQGCLESQRQRLGCSLCTLAGPGMHQTITREQC